MSTNKEQTHFIVEETFQSENIDKRKELLEKLFLQIIRELENLKH
jgi:hypothetical protein